MEEVNIKSQTLVGYSRTKEHNSIKICTALAILLYGYFICLFVVHVEFGKTFGCAILTLPHDLRPCFQEDKICRLQAYVDRRYNQ